MKLKHVFDLKSVVSLGKESQIAELQQFIVEQFITSVAALVVKRRS